MYSYQGLDEVSLLHSPMWYLAKLRECYLDLYRLVIKDDSYGNSFISYVVLVFWILILVIVCMKCVSLIIEKRYINMLLTCMFLAVMPIAVYAMKFLSEGTIYHRLMVQSGALLWIFAVVLLDNLEAARINTFLKEVLVLIIFINAGNYIVGANISYFGFYNGYEKTYALFTRVVDRIEQLPDYKSAEYLYISGSIKGGYVHPAFQKPLNNMTGVTYGIIPYTNTIYVYMINQHIGGDYETIYEQEDKNKVVLTKEYQEMPIWPEEGSVRIIHDTIVVKFDE